MMISAYDLAKKFNLSLLGDDVFVENLGWHDSSLPNMLYFAGNESFLEIGINMHNVSVILTRKDLVEKLGSPDTKTFLITDFPSYTFTLIQNYLVNETEFYFKKQKSEIKTKNIHPSAIIPEHNVYIGKGVEIGANVVVYENTRIEDNARIQANCVIGSEGNQTVRYLEKIFFTKHGGGVLIEEGVEICAGCIVDKGIFRDITTVGAYSMIGSFSYIAHNDKLGKRVVLTFKVGIGGTVTIGDDVIIGSGSTIRNGISVGDKAFISMGAVVTQDVAAGNHVSGNFAIAHPKYMDFIKSIR